MQLTGYQHQIQMMTDCPLLDVPMIEDIMRNDVLHSTLDHLNMRQFRRAALEAKALLNEMRPHYEAFYHKK